MICTKVDAGVASPTRVSDTGFIRLIKYETGIRTKKAPIMP